MPIQSLFAFEYKEEYKDNGWNVYDTASEFRRQVIIRMIIVDVVMLTKDDVSLRVFLKLSMQRML